MRTGIRYGRGHSPEDDADPIALQPAGPAEPRAKTETKSVGVPSSASILPSSPRCWLRRVCSPRASTCTWTAMSFTTTCAGTQAPSSNGQGAQYAGKERGKATGARAIAFVESKASRGTEALNAQPPGQWHRRARRAEFRWRDQPIAAERNLVVATRVNPWAVRERTLKVTVRAWNSEARGRACYLECDARVDARALLRAVPEPGVERLLRDLGVLFFGSLPSVNGSVRFRAPLPSKQNCIVSCRLMVRSGCDDAPRRFSSATCHYESVWSQLLLTV